jgi:hypothetical protein
MAGGRPRRPSLADAVEALTKAGVEIARVEIDRAGKIVIVTGKSLEASNQQDELDVELEQWEARRGQG